MVVLFWTGCSGSEFLTPGGAGELPTLDPGTTADLKIAMAGLAVTRAVVDLTGAGLTIAGTGAALTGAGIDCRIDLPANLLLHFSLTHEQDPEVL